MISTTSLLSVHSGCCAESSPLHVEVRTCGQFANGPSSMPTSMQYRRSRTCYTCQGLPIDPMFGTSATDAVVTTKARASDLRQMVDHDSLPNSHMSIATKGVVSLRTVRLGIPQVGTARRSSIASNHAFASSRPGLSAQQNGHRQPMIDSTERGMLWTFEALTSLFH